MPKSTSASMSTLPRATAQPATGGRAPGTAPTSEQSGTLQRKRYAPCSGGSEVELVAIEGGGHSWPGGERLARFLDPPSAALHATDEIWRFFSRH